MTTAPRHLSRDELEAGLDAIRQAPREKGTVLLIVRRPQTEAREITDSAELHVEDGLVGDNWKARGSTSTPDGAARLDMQLTLMNARVIGLIAGGKEFWPLAGDQLFVDLDLSAENLPPGTQLALGSAVVQISEAPHTGCKKFAARFGVEAMKWINAPEGRRLQMRGINAQIVKSGTVRVGDSVQKVPR